MSQMQQDLTFRPQLSKKSIELSKRGIENYSRSPDGRSYADSRNVSVHDRLYNSMRANEQAQHFSSYYKSQITVDPVTHLQQFMPQINKYSQLIKRADKV